jgi:MarR-like DNA-binding transcriptional regulator SgrR of sgrS sRNA
VKTLAPLSPESQLNEGQALTAAQVIKSIDHAKQLHDEAMKGLFEMVTAIEAKDERSIVFHLNRPVAQSQILHKLTEPVYGVVFIKPDGSMDLGKTTGPFTLRVSSASELVLDVNPHWYAHQEAMPKSVIIRKPKTATPGDQDGFADDAWPNIMSSSSLMPESSVKSFKEKHYSIWNRNLDRLFFFSPGARMATTEGRQFFQALATRLNKNELMNGLQGYHLSNQFFPPGYVIFDPEFKPATVGPEIPAEFKKRPLKLLAAEGRVGTAMQTKIASALKKATGQAPQFRMVALNELFKVIDEGDYDILVMTLAVNDPNAEGPVSFIFGLQTPLIPNSAGDSGNFKARIIQARALDEKSRNAEYRKVFTQAVKDGCLLPLFHFSSIVIARDGIDLSKIPTTDETVAFAKVRFK